MLEPREVAAKIEEITAAHYVAVKVKRWHEAPQAWRYEIVPLRRTLVSGKAGKMTTASGLRSRAEDIGVGLGVESVRIVQNGQLFIEIGKLKPDVILASKLYLKKHIGHPLKITLGIDMDNKPTTIDLEDYPAELERAKELCRAIWHVMDDVVGKVVVDDIETKTKAAGLW